MKKILVLLLLSFSSLLYCASKVPLITLQQLEKSKESADVLRYLTQEPSLAAIVYADDVKAKYEKINELITSKQSKLVNDEIFGIDIKKIDSKATYLLNKTDEFGRHRNSVIVLKITDADQEFVDKLNNQFEKEGNVFKGKLGMFPVYAKFENGLLLLAMQKEDLDYLNQLSRKPKNINVKRLLDDRKDNIFTAVGIVDNILEKKNNLCNYAIFNMTFEGDDSLKIRSELLLKDPFAKILSKPHKQAKLESSVTKDYIYFIYNDIPSLIEYIVNNGVEKKKGRQADPFRLKDSDFAKFTLLDGEILGDINSGSVKFTVKDMNKFKNEVGNLSYPEEKVEYDEKNNVVTIIRKNKTGYMSKPRFDKIPQLIPIDDDQFLKGKLQPFRTIEKEKISGVTLMGLGEKEMNEIPNSVKDLQLEIDGRPKIISLQMIIPKKALNDFIIYCERKKNKKNI